MDILATHSPFKFLDFYRKEDYAIFFGREQEVDELYARLFETNLILFYGTSGTGKTSLIQCGLNNKFESTDWLPLFIRRNDNIINSFYTCLKNSAITQLPESAGFIQHIKSIYLDHFKPIYLVFDQFEELLILGTKEEQTNFFSIVNEILETDLQVKVLVSIREEYIAELSEFERNVPSLYDNRQRIEKMNSLNVERVIRETAKALNIDIDDTGNPIDKIINNLWDKRYGGLDLANLQVYLDWLYREDVKRMKGETRKVRFDLALVEKAGDLGDVLAAFLEEEVIKLERDIESNFKTRKGIPKDILFALVTDNGTKQVSDLAILKADFSSRKGIPEPVIDFCINRFKDMRIIREVPPQS